MLTFAGISASLVMAAFGAIAVGLTLGLLGSGGAILTVPILVYLVGHGEKSAIVESLAIVGSIAAVGAGRAWRARRVDVPSVILLAIPGIGGTVLGAHIAQLVSGTVQLSVLAALMVVAATLMARPSRPPPSDLGTQTTPGDSGTPRLGSFAIAMALLQGLGLGFLTGFVGVGGGFLIVPVLVLLRRLPMPTAVGTSLAIITVNALVGFAKYTQAREPIAIDLWTILLFAALGIAGSTAGASLATKLPQATLRRLFAVFLVAMGLFIIVRQAAFAGPSAGPAAGPASGPPSGPVSGPPTGPPAAPSPALSPEASSSATPAAPAAALPAGTASPRAVAGSNTPVRGPSDPENPGSATLSSASRHVAAGVGRDAIPVAQRAIGPPPVPILAPAPRPPAAPTLPPPTSAPPFAPSGPAPPFGVAAE